jgi:hypothetical protein
MDNVKSMEENRSHPKLMKICFYGIVTSLSTMVNSVFSNYFKYAGAILFLDVPPQVVSKRVASFYNTACRLKYFLKHFKVIA